MIIWFYAKLVGENFWFFNFNPLSRLEVDINFEMVEVIFITNDLQISVRNDNSQIFYDFLWMWQNKKLK